MRHYLFFELNRLRRDPKFVLLTVLIPAVLYLMIGSLGMPGETPDQQASKATSMIGMACYGVLMVTVTNGVNISLDRSINWVAQLRTTPLRPSQVVLGKMTSGLLLSLFAVVAIFAVGGFVQDIHLSTSTWLEIGAITWIGSLPFALLGLALGYFSSANTAGPTVMACVVGLSVVGGLWVPIQFFSDTLQHIARALPTNRWAHLSQSIVLDNFSANGLQDLLIVLAWAAGFAALAAVAYRKGALR